MASAWKTILPKLQVAIEDRREMKQDYMEETGYFSQLENSGSEVEEERQKFYDKLEAEEFGVYDIDDDDLE